MKTNETRTASRIYYTAKRQSLWLAEFQPLNPKTGQPWQASRNIKGHDAYQLAFLNSKEPSMTQVIVGRVPAFEVWSNTYKCVITGFSAESLALAAIAAEKARSGK
jgi:hypothetical protein